MSEPVGDDGEAGAPAWRNEVRGLVSGPVVQAHTIQGGVLIQGAGSRHRLEPMSWSEPRSLGELPLSQLLAAHNGVVEFTGRLTELEALRRWRDEEAVGPALLLVHGPGGQGKTRLVSQFAAECGQADWDVLTARQASEAVRAAAATGGAGTAGRLAVVDYADRWPMEDLLELASDPLLADDMPIRLLLVARSAEWWMQVRHEFARRRFRTSQLRLGPLAADVLDRRELFAQARKRFAEVLGVRDAGRIASPSDMAGDVFGLILTIHMAALAAVDAHARGYRPPQDPVRISAYLLDRERAYWRRVHDSGRISIRPTTMARAVFVATLTRPLPHDEAVLVLDGTGVSSNSEPAATVVTDHKVCYPPADQVTVLEPLYPDRLAEDFLALLLPGHGVETYEADAWATTVPSRLLTGEGIPARPGIVQSTLTMLVEAARRWPHLVQRQLDPLLRVHPQLVLAAGGGALAALAELEDLDPDVLEAIEPFLPNGRHVELDRGIAALVERLTQHRITPDTGPATRAVLYADLGTRLGFAGRYAEALAVTQEAVRIRRALADILPQIFQPELARSLIGLGMRFADLRRWNEGLTAVDEAFTIYQKLIDDHPGTFQNEFATTRDLQGTCLSELGRHDQALLASEQAARIHRRLAAANPGAADPELADVLHNLAIKYGQLGRHEDGLAMAQEALEVLRALASTNPQEFRPKLALLLNNISNHLSELGREQEALDAAQEAVHIYRSLVDLNPDAFRADLARALHTCGKAFSALSRTENALAALDESVRILRELSATDPLAFEPALALVLGGYAQDLSNLDRHDEAETAATDAHRIYHDLHLRNPTGLRPLLADSLARLSRVLSKAGHRDRALAPAVEAVTLYRVLSTANPAFAPDLASLLNTLGNRLSTAGRLPEAIAATSESVAMHRETGQAAELGGALFNLATHLVRVGSNAEALAAAEEAVNLHRQLAKESRRYEPELAWMLSNLGVWLHTAGRLDDARAASEQAVRIYRKLAASDPDTFLPHLGRSLKNLSVWLMLLGRWREAQTTIEESVHIIRATADTNPEAAHKAHEEAWLLLMAIRQQIS